MYVVLQLPAPSALVFSVASNGAIKVGLGFTFTTIGEEEAEHPFSPVAVSV